MKFFIDTASIVEIREAISMGIVDGVTTNPSLVAKEGRDFKELISEICQVVSGPVSAEVTSTDTKEMLKEAKLLAKLNENIVVKIPVTLEGLKVIRQLALDGVKTNATLVFSPIQALIAAKAGATYVSPFVGRLDDLSHLGIGVIEQIIEIYSCYEYNTEIIVASIRGPMHVLDSAIAGAHIVTVPFKVLKKLVRHPLTDEGLAVFIKDWKASGKG